MDAHAGASSTVSCGLRDRGGARTASVHGVSLPVRHLDHRDLRRVSRERLSDQGAVRPEQHRRHEAGPVPLRRGRRTCPPWPDRPRSTRPAAGGGERDIGGHARWSPWSRRRSGRRRRSATTSPRWASSSNPSAPDRTSATATPYDRASAAAASTFCTLCAPVERQVRQRRRSARHGSPGRRRRRGRPAHRRRRRAWPALGHRG